MEEHKEEGKNSEKSKAHEGKPSESEDISIDFSKMKSWFKPKQNAAKAEHQTKQEHAAEKVEKTNHVSEKKEEISKKDDDIVIDFSAVRNLFSKKSQSDGHNDAEKKKHAHHEKTAQAADDEISIDLGGIKNKIMGIFKGESQREKGDDDIAVDWGKVGAFFRTYGIFFLALIPILLAIHVRMEAAGLPITDQWAQDTIINGIKGQIAAQISAQYPNLPQNIRDQQTNAELQKQLETNWPQIQQTIGLYSTEYKKYFQDPQGIPYMPDIDTYYWMRYAENVLDHGYAGDEMREFGQYDTFQLAPEGRYVFPDTFPSYFLAYFHKFLTTFSSQLTLVQTMSYYPVLVAALSTLLVFLIALKVSNGVGAMFASAMFAVNTAFLGRSLYGHADNDGWVLFFPLLITWLFFEMLDRDKMWKVAAIGALAGVLLGVFTYAWAGGWWFIFDLILGMAGIAFLYLVVRNITDVRKEKLHFFKRKEVSNLIIGVGAFVLFSAIAVSFAQGFQSFFTVALGPLSFTTIKDPVTPTLWPNVLTTVAELNTGSFNQALQSVGGKFLFYIGVLGIILALFKKNREGRTDIRYTILLALWFIATCYATIKGIRFTLLLGPAYAVAFGTAIGMLYALFSRWLSKELHVHKAISSILLIVLFGLLLIGPVKTAYGVAKNDLPLVNDTWWNALTAIREGTKENAIITSWWDFGHHFKEIAKRPVTFDGTTQTFRPAYWVGKLFMIDDEKLSIGILRMLDCSAKGDAFNVINEEFQNHANSIQLLEQIITTDRQSAKRILERKGFSTDEAEKILASTHCEPPEGIVIASNDMIGKSGVWSHFGSWNFERADIWYNVRGKDMEPAINYMREKYNYTQSQAESIYYEVSAIPSQEEGNRWIAPWPGYGGEVSCQRSQDEIFACSNGFNFNYTSKVVYAVSQGNLVLPKRFAYVTREGVKVIENGGSAIDAGLTFYPAGKDSMTAIVSSPELVGGIFTTMFYLNGHGLRSFDPFFSERGLIGTDVKVYKADWVGGDAYINQGFIDLLDQIENVTREVPAAPIEISEVPAENATV